MKEGQEGKREARRITPQVIVKRMTAKVHACRHVGSPAEKTCCSKKKNRPRHAMRGEVPTFFIIFCRHVLGVVDTCCSKKKNRPRHVSQPEEEQTTGA